LTAAGFQFQAVEVHTRRQGRFVIRDGHGGKAGEGRGPFDDLADDTLELPPRPQPAEQIRVTLDRDFYEQHAETVESGRREPPRSLGAMRAESQGAALTSRAM
jgi:hypothetical protein